MLNCGIVGTCVKFNDMGVKNMKRLMIIGMTILMAVSMSGCLSYGVYEGSKKRVAMRKAVTRGDAAAIRALKDE